MLAKPGSRSSGPNGIIGSVNEGAATARRGNHLLSRNPGTGVGTALSPDVILLKRAVLAFRSGDKKVARELLAEAADHNPENELVWLWRASAARTRSEARNAVERVLELNPDNEKAQSWIKKLQPGYVPPPKADEAPAEAPQNGYTNGVAYADEAVEEEQHAAEASQEEVASSFFEETAAAVEEDRTEQAVEDSAAPVEQEQAAEAVEEDAPAVEPERAEDVVEETVAAVEEDSEEPYEEQRDKTAYDFHAQDYAEPEREEPSAGDGGTAAAEADASVRPSDAEERLAALEAYLQRGGREEEETESYASGRSEGFGWGEQPQQQESKAAEAEQASPAEAWGRLQAETTDNDEQQDMDEETGGDPLVGLLDANERSLLDDRGSSYQEQVDGERESDPAQDRDYQDRLAELRGTQPVEGDVWSSLGMAGMDEAPPEQARAAEPAVEPPAAKAKAAGMGFAEMGISAKAEEERNPAPPAEEAESEEEQGCFICEKLAPEQDGVCSSCRSIVDIRLHEMAPRHEGADRATLTRALEKLRAKIEKKATADLCVKAAVTSLNLKQSNQALTFLREACRLRPHDRELLNYYDEIESRPLILAVDDSKTVQKMISTVLEKESYRVSAAEDGLAAIAKLDEEMPKLILLDITMPRMDGYQVCKVITGNSATKHIPVIMLSGKDGFFDKVKGKMVGASNYITKPFDPNDLTRTIAKFLNKQK